MRALIACKFYAAGLPTATCQRVLLVVAIKVKLGLVEMLTTRDPEKASATIVALKGDADEALETLRDLARGIYPPMPAYRGVSPSRCNHSQRRQRCRCMSTPARRHDSVL